MHKVLANQNDSCLFWLLKFLCSCCFNKDDFWKFERASEPSDIIWENMGFTPFEKSQRECLSSLGTFIAIVVSFVLIFLIKNQAKGLLDEAIENGTFSGLETAVVQRLAKVSHVAFCCRSV